MLMQILWYIKIILKYINLILFFEKMSLIESCWKHRQAIIEKLSNGNIALKIAIAKLLKFTVR
jgi:hypothetical protein